MPGICGQIGLGSRAEPTAVLHSMGATLSGTTDSAAGAFVDPGLEWGVAWKEGRGVFQRCAPVWNRGRTVGMLLTGELFGEGSIESWIEAYEKEDWAFLERLNGWFSGVLMDLRQQRVAVFTDRYGLGRLYYSESADTFLFASEAKALLGCRADLRRFDERGLGEWLSCGCALQNRTLFEGVRLLPPAAIWTFSRGNCVSKRRYFDPATWEHQPALSLAAYEERLRETFRRSLGWHFQESDRVAMSLTGGLDGRMIMSWCGRGAGELPCYTFNGPFRDCADVRLARRVAEVCDQRHQTIPVGDEFLEQFPALAEEAVSVTDGAMDVTGGVELYANRLAAQIAPVRLTGNYGSEILRRYVAFRPRPFPATLLSPELQERTRAAAVTYAEESGGNPLSFIAFKQVPWHHFARFAVERSAIRVRSPFLDNELVALAFQAPPAGTGLELYLNLIASGRSELGRIPTDRGVVFPPGGIANRARRSVAEFLAKAEYAYDYGMPHWLARWDQRLGALRLERFFLGRQKFCHFRYWYRHQLGPFVRRMLLDPRALARSYLNRAAVERMVAAHLNGSENWTVEIHKLLSLELVQRTILERA